VTLSFSGLLLEELEADPLGLVNHPKSCYVIQKLVQVATTDALRHLAAIVARHFLQMSVNSSGCYVVQALLCQTNVAIKQASNTPPPPSPLVA
jgi:hypothetical protein